MGVTLDRRAFLRSGTAVGGVAVAGGTLSGRARGQSGDSTRWELRFDDGGDVEVRDVAEIPDGYLFVGAGRVDGAGTTYAWGAVADGETGEVTKLTDPREPSSDEALNQVIPVGDGSVYLFGQRATDQGSVPVIGRSDVTLEGSSGRWEEPAEDPGAGLGGTLTPDGGAIGVGSITRSASSPAVGILSKWTSAGTFDDSVVVETNGDTVIHDIVHVDPGYVFVGTSRPPSGPPRALAGATSEDLSDVRHRTFTHPDWPGAVLRSAAVLPDAEVAAVGHVVGPGSGTAAYGVGLDPGGGLTIEQVFAAEAGRAAWTDVEWDPVRELIHIAGYRQTQRGLDAWYGAYTYEAEEVAGITLGGPGEDAFNAVLIRGDPIAAGYRSDDGSHTGWAASVAVDLPDASGGGGGPPPDRDRGFFTNTGSEPAFLTDVFNLTVLGFVLSAIGLMYQLMEGR